MRQYKVLMVAELGNEWNSGWWKKAGFDKNGHAVITFNPRTEAEPRDRLIDIIKETKPDFLLHFKDELPASVFEELRKYIKVVQWYPDPLIPDWLPEYVKAADIFITMSEGLLGELRKLNPDSFWLTEAFEPSYFEMKNITEKDIKEFSTEVTFVGNLGSKPRYLARRDSLKAVVKNGFKLKWWGPKLTRKLSTLHLILGKVGRSYGGKFVWGEDHAKIAKLSKIYLGFDSMPQIRQSMSERLYIAVGCGAFYMCQHIDGIEDILVPDKEIVTFRSEQEMIDKIKYYLEHEDARLKIAEAGNRRVLKEHTFEVRIRELLNIIEGVWSDL